MYFIRNGAASSVGLLLFVYLSLASGLAGGDLAMAASLADHAGVSALPVGGSPTASRPVISSPAATQAAAGPKPASPSTQPRRIETIEHDFGQVWAGEPLVHTFSLTNTSSRVLNIREARATCGCTTTGQWEKQVAPGRTWTLEVSLATVGRRGPLRKAVTVLTDDPDRPEVYLVVKAQIRSRYEFLPSQSIGFGSVQTGTAARRTLQYPGTSYALAISGDIIRMALP